MNCPQHIRDIADPEAPRKATRDRPTRMIDI